MIYIIFKNKIEVKLKVLGLNLSIWVQIMVPSIFTLIAALLSGYMSYKGTLKAVKNNIEEQKQILLDEKMNENSKNKLEIKKVTRLIYNDITIAICRSFIELDRKKNLPMYSDYSKAITMIQNKLTSEEIYSIYTLYGIIEKIRYTILTYRIDDASIESSIYYNYQILQSEVFEKEKIENINAYSAEQRTKDYILEQVNSNTKGILNKLKSIMDES